MSDKRSENDVIIDGVLWLGGRTPVGPDYNKPRETDKAEHDDEDPETEPTGPADPGPATE